MRACVCVCVCVWLYDLSLFSGCAQFDDLLNDQTDLEHFMFWAEDVIQSAVGKVSHWLS